jgi:hypothetical protein
MITNENFRNYDKNTFIDIITGLLYDKETLKIVGCL